MGEALSRELEENVRRSGEAARQRAVATPDDIKVALQTVGAALHGDPATLDEYRKIREYLGFLQLTCALNIEAVARHDLQKKAAGGDSDG